MKSLLLGVVVIILLGFGGLVYRNAVERPYLPTACTLDAMVCPDGTSLGRTGPFCEFPACPPPNVSLTEARVAFAIPEGFTEVTLPDAASIAAYEKPGPTPSEPSTII
ncbi:MAG: hypothetical protein Q8L30_00205, partial [bacterium]|nr:hypothetical protein [bacterium]